MDRKHRKSENGSTPAIIKAARQLFLKKGYDGVNLDTIAKKASVSRQTLYNIFGSKEAIFKAVLNDHWSSIAGQSDLEAETFPPTASAAEVLRIFADRALAFVDNLEQVDFTRLVIAESRHAAWIGHEFYRVGKGPLLASLTSEIMRLDVRGLLNCNNPSLAAHQFFGLLLEMTFWPYVMSIGAATRELPDREEAVDGAVSMFTARYGVKVKRDI
jgi:TetR/AcrR family transcriptional regulator, regulator of autoinduction and epiphytic fitness